MPSCSSSAGVAAETLSTAPSGASVPRSTTVPLPAGWMGASRLAITSVPSCAGQRSAFAADSAIVMPPTVIASPCSIGRSCCSTAGSAPAYWKSSMRKRPDGMRFTSSGTSAARRSKSSSSSGTSTRPASARRCTIAFVEPPRAALTLIAFSNASRVSTSDGRTFSFTRSTIRRPAACDIAYRRESTAGIAAMPGSCIPSASVMHAIVEAVPIVMQWPGLRAMHASATVRSSSVSLPARCSSVSRHTSVPEPMS